MPRVGFEPTISAGERPKTCALDRAATGTGYITVSQSYLGLVVFTVPLNKRLTKLLHDDDCDYLIDYHITNFYLSLNKILEMCTPILGINIKLRVTE